MNCLKEDAMSTSAMLLLAVAAFGGASGSSHRRHGGRAGLRYGGADFPLVHHMQFSPHFKRR